MDAAEVDGDVVLQRYSTSLIAGLETSLKPLLWRTMSKETKIRKRVRSRDLEPLLLTLDQFQELPQLLDPHLHKFVPLLADSLLAFLQSPPSRAHIEQTSLLTPVDKAVGKLLYRFCKVRGDKVIVRFFSTETRYLELLLAAIEDGTQSTEVGQLRWEWEETYITLLWLSQLLLAPFDLASISSEVIDIQPSIPGFTWPENVPGVTVRVIPLALRFLSSPDRKRDAAKALLVRVAMRKDMQELGIMKALIDWALLQFQISSAPGSSTHSFLGVLSFLAGILTASIGTMDTYSYLSPIFKATQDIANGTEASFKSIRASVMARKMIIKILRTITVILLQCPESMEDAEVIESTISYLLEALADSATPVRIAASKALSVVGLKLRSDFASEVVEEVLSTFERNVIWVTSGNMKTRDLSRVDALAWHGLVLTLAQLIYRRSVQVTNLPRILNALRLGLSFEQRSTSGSSVGTNVRDAACFGIWALARRYTVAELDNVKLSPTFTSLDAHGDGGSAVQTLATELVLSACLDPAGNIRRGSSAALQELVGRHPDKVIEGIKLVQIVDYHAVALRSKAVEEVAFAAAQLHIEYYQHLTTALLGWRGVRDHDASIRRVVSTVFGELVWLQRLKEPDPWAHVQAATDIIVKRINCLEPREIGERHGLILALATILDKIAEELSFEKAEKLFQLFPCIREHGPADAVRHSATVRHLRYKLSMLIKHLIESIDSVVQTVSQIYNESKQPTLLLEAMSRLVLGNCPLIRASCVFEIHEADLEPSERLEQTPGPDGDISLECQLTDQRLGIHPCVGILKIQSFFHNPTSENVFDYFSRMNATYDEDFPLPEKLINSEFELMRRFLQLGDTETVEVVSLAAADLSVLLRRNVRDQWRLEWEKNAFQSYVPARKEKGQTYLRLLFQFPLGPRVLFEPDWENKLIRGVRDRWTAPTAVPDIESKVIILKSIASSNNTLQQTLQLIFQGKNPEFLQFINRGLEDHSVNAHGDVGSLVRIEAAKAAGVLLSTASSNSDFIESWLGSKWVAGMFFRRLLPNLMKIASEKLDRVRMEGKKTLLYLPNTLLGLPSTIGLQPMNMELEALSISSKEYFRYLLNIHIQPWWDSNPTSPLSSSVIFLQGYVTSAESGSEDLVRASRTALVEFCEVPQYRDHICAALFQLLKQGNESKVDRIIIPALEVISFLFDMGIFQQCTALKWTDFFYEIELSHARTKSVRRIEAAIKCYGGLLSIMDAAPADKILKKLTMMLRHKYPRIKSCAADEIFVRTGMGKGVDWDNENLETLTKELRIKNVVL